VKFDGSAFCSAYLRPIVSQVSTVTVTGPSTDTEYWQTTITSIPSTTAPKTTSKSLRNPGPIPHPTISAHPTITASPKIAERVDERGLQKRDYTVPDYLTGWWYYGRLDPGCSCIITSAMKSSFTSYTETASIYNVTVVSCEITWKEGFIDKWKT
jgi:hypothetical protein